MPHRELPDPAELAARQFQRDVRRFKNCRWLFRHKCERMAVSPFHFLRGTAPLFYEALRRSPHLAAGPNGKGWLVGDLHLENFGAYRPESVLVEGRAARVVFDVNDFDDAFVGPQRLDILRLLTSTVLAARNWGLPTPGLRAAAEVVLGGVLLGRRSARVGAPPPAVRKFLERVASRTRRGLLDARTRLGPRGRRFIWGQRYRSLPRREQQRAEAAFAAYVRRLPPDPRWRKDAWEVQDVAFRIAGTGSLGSMRLAVLVAGKGGANGGWLFDLKEEGGPAGTAFASTPPEHGADRVLRALHTCLLHPPRMAGKTEDEGRSLLVRRLTPQEDRLDMGALSEEDRQPVLAYLGGLAAALHVRGARHAPRWEAGEARTLIDNAITLAGLHEAAAVHYATLVRDAGLQGAPVKGPEDG